jgi:hypothetical protein
LNAETAPFILGISTQLTSEDNLYIRVVENAEMSSLPLERFNLLIARSALWENLCHVLVYNASRVYAHCARITQMSSYDLIKIQLQELMHEPERVRLNTTAANYILGRTWLSRSGTMKILSQLRSQGYITLQRGVLLAMDPLPDHI